MTKEILIQFVGFTSTALEREYTFMVQETAIEPREYKVGIANEAFNEHRLRFQDGPDVCSLKLRRELVAGAGFLSESHYHLSNAELEDYRSSHEAPRRMPFARKPAEKF